MTHLLRPLFALLFVGALLAPLGSAQMPPVVLSVKFQSPTDPISPDNATVVQGVAKMVADVTKTLTNVNGIPVTYVVTHVPTWASVTVSPSHDVFTLPLTPSLQSWESKSFTVSVLAAPGTTADANDFVEIRATVTPGAPSAPQSTTAQFPILFRASSEPCDHGAAAAGASAPAPEKASPSGGVVSAAPNTERAEDAAPVAVQSVAPASGLPTPWLAVAAFGVAGAGVGLALRRRL
jgi:hypothetical protein